MRLFDLMVFALVLVVAMFVTGPSRAGGHKARAFVEKPAKIVILEEKPTLRLQLQGYAQPPAPVLRLEQDHCGYAQPGEAILLERQRALRFRRDFSLRLQGGYYR